MKPAPFDYVRPDSLAGAVSALAEHGDHAKVLAGGQSLIPLLSMRLMSPQVLVDINRISELAYVRADQDGVRVGALARHSDVEHDDAASEAQPLLRKALRMVAHPTIRNRGTTVGSIAHADPAAEMPAVLAVLEGRVSCRSTRGTREIAAGDFFTGLLDSAAEPDELVTEVFFPALPANAGSAFHEISRRHGDYALCGVAGVVQTDGERRVTGARAGLLSVADSPCVIDLTEALRDGSAEDADLDHVVELVTDSVQPEPDIHATADYRRHLAGVLTRKAVAAAYAEAVAR